MGIQIHSEKQSPLSGGGLLDLGPVFPQQINLLLI